MLKLKDGFILRCIAGEYVVIPSGEDLDLNLMITLNSTGAFLWQRLENGAGEQELVQALLDEYDVTEERAATSVTAFIAKLHEHELLA